MTKVRGHYAGCLGLDFGKLTLAEQKFIRGMTDFTATDMPPQDAAAARNIEDTPLTTILDLLQGEDHECPDAALARLPADHLQRIATAAQRKSQDCLDLIRCLVDCTGMLLMRTPPADACDRVLHLNLHLASLLDDHQRWDDLRENAAYYRHHPDVAARIASEWKAARA